MADPNTLYTLLDPVVESMLALSEAAVNDDLAAHWDDTAEVPHKPVRTTANYPVTPQQLAGTGLPLLSMYRQRQRQQETSRVHRNDSVVSIEVTYIAPTTNTDQMGARWPLLNAVWDSMVDALCNNGHDAYEGTVPSEAGVFSLDLSSLDKIERYLRVGSGPGPGALFPTFVGRFTVKAREVADISALSDFLSLRAKQYVDGNTSEPADVDQIIESPAGVAQREGEAEEPFSEESN